MADTGGGAAYIRLQKPDDSLSQASQFWGAQQGRVNADEKLAAERAGIRKAEQEKYDAERYSLDPSQYKTSDFGFQDVNADNINYATERVNREAGLMREAAEMKAKGNLKGAEAKRNEAMSNRASFAARQATAGTLKSTFDDLQKLVQAGKSSGWNKGLENLYKGTTMPNGKMRTVINKDGQDVLVTTFTDDEGQTHQQMSSAADINSGVFRPYQKQDINGDVAKISKSLGSISKTTSNTKYSHETKLWSDAVHGKAAREAIKPLVNNPEYMADMVDQLDLYDEMGIDRNNPPTSPVFSEKQKKIVEDRLLSEVKGQYDEVNKTTYHGHEFAPRVPKAKTAEETDLSKLRYDAQQAVHNHDYSGLIGEVQMGKDGTKQTVSKVVESPDGKTLVLLDSAGEEIKRVSNSERGIIEHKLGSSGTMYGKATVEKAMKIAPEAYERETVKASDITDAVAKQYDPNGKFIGSEEDFTNSLQDLYPDADIVAGAWSPFHNEIVVNGMEVNLTDKSKGQVEQEIRKALGFKNGQAQAIKAPSQQKKTQTKQPTAAELIAKYSKK